MTFMFMMDRIRSSYWDFRITLWFCVADPSLVPHKVSVLKHLVELFFFCSLASYALLTGVAIQSNQKIFIHQIQALIYFTSGCRTL